jgi:hypothetical protein
MNDVPLEIQFCIKLEIWNTKMMQMIYSENATAATAISSTRISCDVITANTASKVQALG